MSRQPVLSWKFPCSYPVLSALALTLRMCDNHKSGRTWWNWGISSPLRRSPGYLCQLPCSTTYATRHDS